MTLEQRRAKWGGELWGPSHAAAAEEEARLKAEAPPPHGTSPAPPAAAGLLRRLCLPRPHLLPLLSRIARSRDGERGGPWR